MRAARGRARRGAGSWPLRYAGAGAPAGRDRVWGMQVLVAAAERSWHDIPGVRIVGAVLGVLLLAAAIRSMFGRR
jgi:hypothetical protein